MRDLIFQVKYLVLNMNQLEPTHRKTIVADENRNPIVTVLLERAVTKEQQRKGLMHRESLGELEGMIFISEYDEFFAVWMKNTQFSLDLIFLDRMGRVITIYHSVPAYLADIHYRPVAPCRYLIEMNGGFCERYNIKEGSIFIPVHDEMPTRKASHTGG